MHIFLEKLMPLLMVNQVAQPVQLLHNLTSDEPDWKAYGMSVAEGSMWMLLGMASGVLGDKARLFTSEEDSIKTVYILAKGYIYDTRYR